VISKDIKIWIYIKYNKDKIKMQATLTEKEKEILIINKKDQNDTGSNKEKIDRDISGEPDSINDNSREEDSSQFRTGRWHPNEHIRFIKGCLLFGNNWKKVSIFCL
jgi:hypothetical protein